MHAGNSVTARTGPIEDLETAAKLVFNARLFDDPAEWHRRLSEAAGHLDNIQIALAQLRERLQKIETMAPKRLVLQPKNIDLSMS